MIPKINGRGTSFKGVIAYLSHDKGELETSERMSWYETGNMHTDDPEKAAKIMAWTDMNREQIRADNDGSPAGRKASAGNVWHFSLAWALGENPGEDHQRDTMQGFLEKHELSDHEYILFGHNDTAHIHAHGVVNLVHPETGLVKDIGLDKRRSQQWALDYEREHGIHCQRRVDNALKREHGEPVKYRDTKQDYADKITRAYYASDNGKAFIHALKEEGLELGKARRGDRNYVIVDDRGDIQKLSRQLQIEEKGKLKTQAIQALLSDIDFERIKDADTLSHDIKTRDTNQPMKEPTNRPDDTFSEHWDRDQENREWDESIIDAGIKADTQRSKDHLKQSEKPTKQRGPDPADRSHQWAQNLKDHAKNIGHHDKSFARELDSSRDMDARHDRSRLRLEETLKQTYTREEQEQLLSDAQDYARKSDTFFGHLTGRHKAALEEAEAYQKNLDNITQREQEQRGALEAQISAEREQSGYRREPSSSVQPPGGFAEELDKTRLADELRDKEAALNAEISGQQADSIEEGSKHRLEAQEPPRTLEIAEQAIPPEFNTPDERRDWFKRQAALHDNEKAPELEQAQEIPEFTGEDPGQQRRDYFSKLAAVSEPELSPQINPPAPELEPQYEPPEYSNPISDHDHSAEIITSHEPSAPGNDNTQSTEQAPQQEQSRDSGGYER